MNVQRGGQRPPCLLTRALSGHLPVSCGSAFQEEESGAASPHDLVPPLLCWPLHPTWDPQGPSHPARAIPMGSSKTAVLLFWKSKTRSPHASAQHPLACSSLTRSHSHLGGPQGPACPIWPFLQVPLHQLLWSVCCSTNTLSPLLPQDLWVCSQSNICIIHLLISSRSLLKCHLL